LYLLGVKKAVFEPLGGSASKSPQRELLEYLLGYQAEKNMTGLTGDNVLF